MTEIVLIRHGQASFGTDDYDRLSELGVSQSQRLREYLTEMEIGFDAVYSGPHRRQLETARHGSPGEVEVVVHEGFAEYRAEPLFDRYLPLLLEADPEFAPVAEKMRSDRRAFQLTLERVLAAWCAEDDPPAGIDPWHAFRDRVVRGLTDLIENHRGRQRVAVFSSAGAIGCAVGYALGMSLFDGLKLSYALYNTAICRLNYGRSGWSLNLFNGLAHLEQPRYRHLITFR